MGKIKRKKLSSFETKTLAELKAMNDSGNNVYIPYIQPVNNNYKHEITECAEKLTAGENVQITNDNRVNATDTRYVAGDNIEIATDGTVAYVGDAPQTYAAGRGLRLTNNVNTLALKLEMDGGATFTSLYGSKLKPVTFKNNYTLELAGNAMDSLFIKLRSSDRSGGYKVVCLDNDGVTLRTALNARATKKYYCSNGTSWGWYQSSDQPSGYTKIKTSDYTHFAIDTENIGLVSMSALFLQNHSGIETIINMINRTSITYTDFVIENDTSYNADAHVYEQGLLSSCFNIPSNASTDHNYGVVVKYQAKAGGGYDIVTSFGHSYYITNEGQYREAMPPFCGNVLSLLDANAFSNLYSTIRFIPAVYLDTTNSKTTISLVSTEY